MMNYIIIIFFYFVTIETRLAFIISKVRGHDDEISENIINILLV